MYLSLNSSNFIHQRVHSTRAGVSKAGSSTIAQDFLELPTPCIFIPTMHCSSPVRLHPKFHEIRAPNDAWALDLAGAETPAQQESVLCEKLVLLSCQLYPTALNSVIDTIVKYMQWFILFDTHVDNTELLADHGATSHLVESYLQVLDNNINIGTMELLHSDNWKSGRFLSHFHAVLCDLQREMPPELYSRFSQSVRALLEASSSLNKLREEGVVPPPAELLEQRRVVSGVTCLVILLEYALGIHLEEKTPEIKEAGIVANEHFCTVNDVISFPGEYLRGDFHNLPSAFCMSEKMSIQEAVVETCKMTKAQDERFMELHKLVTSSKMCSQGVKSYMDGLGYLMSGNLDWCWKSGRYHGPDWVAPGVSERQGIMYLEPIKRSAIFKPCIL